MFHVNADGTPTIEENTTAPHILVVDEDSEIVSHIQDYLERQGYRVSASYSGKEALEEAVNLHPDLMILNLALSDLNGLEVCQQIKANADLGYLPIIILTEAREERLRLAGMLSGADDYLPHPVVEKDLLLRVQALLRTRRQLERLFYENQKLTKDLQQRNTELERALEIASQSETLKSHIIESVSHELRTPMLQVKSAVSMLVEVIREGSTAERDQNIARMATQSVARLEDLILNIAQLHLAENLNLSPIMLKDAVVQSINILRRSWSYQNEIDRINTHLESTPPVMGHHRGVSRLISILVENALKFSQDKDVDVYIEHIDAREVRVSIQDYGIGIAPEHHQQIFDSFYQVDQGSTRRFGGVGVGLALAQMLARGMNTEIKVKSQPGKGSIFWFILPVADLHRE